MPSAIADDRVELRVVGQDDLAPVLRLEAADDPLARPREDAERPCRRSARLAARAARAGTLLAREDGVPVHRAVHAARAGTKRSVAARDEDEAEPLGPHRDPARDEVGELDGRVLLAPDPGDLAAALERVEPLPQGVRLGLGDVELPDLGEGEDPRPLLPEEVEDLRVARQHARESNPLRLRVLFGLPGREEARDSRRGSPARARRRLRSQPHERHRITPSTGREDGLCGSGQYGLGQFQGKSGAGMGRFLRTHFTPAERRQARPGLRRRPAVRRHLPVRRRTSARNPARSGAAPASATRRAPASRSRTAASGAALADLQEAGGDLDESLEQELRRPGLRRATPPPSARAPRRSGRALKSARPSSSSSGAVRRAGIRAYSLRDSRSHEARHPRPPPRSRDHGRDARTRRGPGALAPSPRRRGARHRARAIQPIAAGVDDHPATGTDVERQRRARAGRDGPDLALLDEHARHRAGVHRNGLEPLRSARADLLLRRRHRGLRHRRAGATADCATATGDCYLLTVTGARPVPHWDITFTETLSSSGSRRRWTIHVGESFTDVPTTHPFYAYIEKIFHMQVTGGCGAGLLLPGPTVTRAQMAVFLLKSEHGSTYVPPACTGRLRRRGVPEPFADWIEQLSTRASPAAAAAAITARTIPSRARRWPCSS